MVRGDGLPISKERSRVQMNCQTGREQLKPQEMASKSVLGVSEFGPYAATVLNGAINSHKQLSEHNLIYRSA